LILTLDPKLLDIVGRSFQVTLTALAISIVIGLPIGVWLALANFPGKRVVTAIIYTGMGLPPVVVGLLVYLLLSRSGVLGSLRWLFTLQAIMIAQIILATPVIIGIALSSILGVDAELRLQLRALGATRLQAIRGLLWEARFGLIVGLVAGFGSIISEVGAVMLVGGNIDGRTRVMTTAIVLETQQGHFDIALGLGIVLLAISFVTNFLLVLLQGDTRRKL